MSLKKAPQLWAALLNGLRLVGLGKGDVVFFQVSHKALGPVDYGPSRLEECESIYLTLREVIGAEGTMLFPAFSFSFSRNEDFSAQTTPSLPGEWGTSAEFVEYFRHLPGVVRSTDPMLSVAGFGPRAAELLSGLPPTSYGKGCFYDRLMNVGGKICGVGVGISDAPFLHFVEDSCRVPFRFKKLFTGRIQQDGELKKRGWVMSVPIQVANCLPDGGRLEKMARAEGLCHAAQVGEGQVVAIKCNDFFQLASREIARDPWILARGPASDPIELENARTSAQVPEIRLSHNASMEELISALWRLPRDIVSDGYDAALNALATQAPLVIHEYPTGTECWTWIIPEKWTCHEAWLETIGGRRLFSYADNPLHVVSYSLPVDSEVSRAELFRHLHVHPKLPDAVPFIFKYYERDWGLCCSADLKEALRDDRYRVVIRSDFSYGTLKVGEIVAPGKSSESFVLCAHLCHPAMVNDDLTGVVVGLKVMQELLQRRDLHYTYRFLILPETIGSVAFLSHQKDLIPKMFGGLFLEMLGLENPHALQFSFAGNTEVDRCLARTLKESDLQGWTGPFRTVVGNDERQFNAPGVRIPMLSLSRVKPRNSDTWPYYPEYHSSRDTPELASSRRLAESRDLILKMIDALEGNSIPVNLYQGEIFCSRFGLNVDAYANPEGNRALFDIIFLIDGTRSVAEIARICNVSIESVQDVVEELRRHGLVDSHGGETLVRES